MGFNISNLGSYVQNTKGYAVSAVAKAKLAKALIDSKNAQFGVKGTAAIKKISSTPTFVDGSSCGRTGGTTIALSNKNIKVVKIADEANLCPATLWNTFYADSISKGSSPTEDLLPEFADTLMTERADKIAIEVEKLLWQGNTTITGSSNLKYLDGITLQATSSVSVGGSTVVEKLQALYMSSSVDVRQAEDYHLFVGNDVYDEYAIALAGKNIYKPVEDSTLFGTTAKIFVTPGLNGTRKAYSMKLSNLQFGMDGEDDNDTADLRYSTETAQWYQDFHISAGIAVVFPDEAKYATV